MIGMLINIITLSLLIKFSWGIITIENNTYTGITVVVHNNVPEDQRIVGNLKSLLTSASKSLYKATRHRGYFGEVTIVVPPEWSSRPEYEQVVGGSRFANADVRVDYPHPQYGNNPYTLQPGGCGEPGHYIHLTPEFVAHLNDTTTEEYGDPGKTFVHEWSHLRYGIFDEYGDENDYRTPNYYFDENNEIRVTGCGMNMKGWLKDNDHQRCHMQENGLPDENCQFHPSDDDYDVQGSLMYMHWLSSVEGFCTDSGDVAHNSMAPNQQNLLCDGQSTWSVVSTHSDFLDNNNPPRDNIDTTPTFRIIQPRKNEQGNYVLVLDVSGSMSGRRIMMLHRASLRFVEDQIPDRSRLGIVLFSNEANITLDMTVITKEFRPLIAKTLPTIDNGGNTAIGKGLLRALEMLKKEKIAEDAIIILISDGEENIKPHISDVIDDIIKSKVKIHTIAFGSNATKHLETLVRLTGGRGYFYSDEEILDSQTSVLQSAFFAAASTQADVEIQPVELTNRILFLEPERVKSGHIVIDKTIGKNTRFVFTYSLIGELDITLTSPQNVTYDEKYPGYKHNDFTKTMIFTIASAKPGKWHFDIQNRVNAKQGVGISVTSEPKDIKKQPIRIRAWISDVQFQFPQQAAEAKVFAEVKKQYAPVIEATVIAEIERPDGEHVELELHDNGAGADIRRDDGVYSAYFSDFGGSGRYSVAARVENDGKAKLRLKKQKRNGVLKVSRPLPKEQQKVPPRDFFTTDDLDPPVEDVEENYVDEPVDEFQRSLLAGSFRLEGWKPGDFIPPNRVIDLEVHEISSQDKTVSLSWTSPGDDKETGTASRIDLRFHTKAKHILRNFNQSFEITEADLAVGNLTPLVSGKRHNITVRFNLSDNHLVGNTIFFALRCFDKTNNSAEVSNIAMAYFYVERDDPRAGITPSQITLLTVGVIVAVLLIALVIFVVKRSRSQRWAKKVYIR